MFHKTSLRLTGLYLTILMVISFSFSAALYSLAMREFDRGFRRQTEFINQLPPEEFLPPSFQRQFVASRNILVREAKTRIISELLFVNIAILFLGGGLSYYLAKRTLEPIEDAHTSLERFTADASHELRTPIAAMKSEIEVALLQPKLKVSETKELLRSNLEELDRLTLLTDGLLAIARHEEKPLELKSQPLVTVAEEAFSQIKAAAKEKDITVAVDIDTQLKATFDKQSLREVLVILLDNAVKYSRSKSTVEMQAKTKKEGVAITIIDHGIGIKPEDLPHVFERFYRAEVSRSQATKGHGLGLAIAKQLLKRQGATVTLASQPGKITTATVILPE